MVRESAPKHRMTPVVVASCISFASSSQAAYPSLPAKAGSSVIPLLLLSHEVHSALRGFPEVDGDRHALRRRKLHILCSRPRPGAQSFRCSSSPTKCILHFVGSIGGRWRPALRFVVASCISFASSSQAAYPSLPAKAGSSVISLLLLSHEVHSALRGFHRRPMEAGTTLRRRKLHILRCSSSPDECDSHSLGTRK